MPDRFQWEGSFDPPLILRELAKTRKMEGSRISFILPDYNFWLPILHSAIRANKDVENLKDRCISASLNDASTTLKDPKAFIDRCNKAFEDLSKRPKSSFVLYSTVTYTGPKPINWISDGDTRIQWQPSVGTAFSRAALKGRASLASIRRARRVPDDASGLTTVLAYVSAYNAWDAFEQGSESIDRIRGLLNLLINSSRGMNPFSKLTTPQAVNKFRRGPYQTVHKPDGSLAAEVFWYEPRWHHGHESVKFKNPKDYRAHIIKWWNKYQTNPLKDHISDGLVRYCRALDSHDFEPAFLGMWGALESLTGTQREKYDVTVARVERLFKDYAHIRQVANHIRICRNRSIHAARSPSGDEHDAILIQAEMLPSQILFFCLRHGRRFANTNELFAFLDLPLDLKRVRRQQQLADFFVKYLDR